MKLTEVKLKQMILEAINRSSPLFRYIIKQKQLLALENAIDFIPSSSPLFPFKDKLKATMEEADLPLEGIRHTHSFLDALEPDSPVEQIFRDTINEAHFFLELKGYDQKGNRVPGSSLFNKIDDKINEIMLDNRVEMKKMFDPFEIGKHSQEELLPIVQNYIQLKLLEDPEIAEIFERANKLLKSMYLITFNNAIQDMVQFSALFPTISQSHYQYPD